MGQCSEREGELIDIPRLAHECGHKIAAADIMGQLAEKLAAERIIAEILDNRATIGVGMRFNQLVRRGIREAFEKEGLKILIPGRINDRFMSQDGVSAERCRERE